MQMSTAGLDLLRRSEGFRGRTYLDAAGLPTIGYGHQLVHSECFPNGIAEAQAAQMLTVDLHAAETAVTRMVNVALKQRQFDALVDFCFNVGAGKLATPTFFKDFNAGEYGAAAEEMLRWDHVLGKEMAGLKARRESEFALWNRKGASEMVAV